MYLWYAYAKENGLDLVAVNPSFVVGAHGEYFKQVIGIVHINDVVAAHIMAMEDSKASRRLICSSAVAQWSDIVKMLKDKDPMYPFESKQVHNWKPDNKEGDDNPHSMDTSKMMQLGLAGFKSIPDMLDDCIRSFQEKGFL
uniref:Uncharacterized protein n=1 Tax=Chenopodium quinoa TaxID=63459 RepID=A0A803L7L6_CHEQI